MELSPSILSMKKWNIGERKLWNTEQSTCRVYLKGWGVSGLDFIAWKKSVGSLMTTKKAVENLKQNWRLNWSRQSLPIRTFCLVSRDLKKKMSLSRYEC